MPEAAIAVAFVVFLRILLWLAEPREPERDPALAEVDGINERTE